MGYQAHLHHLPGICVHITRQHIHGGVVRAKSSTYGSGNAGILLRTCVLSHLVLCDNSKSMLRWVHNPVQHMLIMSQAATAAMQSAVHWRIQTWNAEH